MYSYYTELDIAECKKRINEIIKQNRFSIGTIIGKVDLKKDTFYLFKKNLNYHNSFSRIFHGEFIKKEEGTIIQGSFRMDSSVKEFIIIWFCLVIFIGGFISLISLSDIFLGTSYGEGSSVLGLVTPFIMCMIGILVIKLGVRLSKNEEEHILDFIRKTLDVKYVEPHI